MPAQIFHADLYGTREYKYQALLDQDALNLHWNELTADQEFELFVPQASDLREEYQQAWRLTDISPVNVLGFQTHRDQFAIDFDEGKLYQRIADFRSSSITDDQAKEMFDLTDNRDWKIANARKRLQENKQWKDNFTLCLYRPFDIRPVYYDEAAMDYPRRELVRNVLNKRNLCLGLGRQGIAVNDPQWALVSVSKYSVDANIFRRGGINIFPLYLYSSSGGRSLNLSQSFLDTFKAVTSLGVITRLEAGAIVSNTASSLPPGLGMFSEFHGVFNADLAPESSAHPVASENTVTPEDIFHYAYAIFHSPTYRERYAEFLKIDFPRLPLTSDVPLFRALAALGEQLTALHLMERTGPNPAAFPVPGSSSVDAAPKYDADDQRVFINKTQYFAPVPPEVWAFQIGGYQVCHKWLKDRKGRTLTEEDITHYGSIVAALGETIRLMAEIDAVIEEHGGWPLQ